MTYILREAQGVIVPHMEGSDFKLYGGDDSFIDKHPSIISLFLDVFRTRANTKSFVKNPFILQTYVQGQNANLHVIQQPRMYDCDEISRVAYTGFFRSAYGQDHFVLGATLAKFTNITNDFDTLEQILFGGRHVEGNFTRITFSHQEEELPAAKVYLGGSKLLDTQASSLLEKLREEAAKKDIAFTIKENPARVGPLSLLPHDKY